MATPNDTAYVVALASGLVEVPDAVTILVAAGLDADRLASAEHRLGTMELEPTVRDRALLLVERTRMLSERAREHAGTSERLRERAVEDTDARPEDREATADQRDATLERREAVADARDDTLEEREATAAHRDATLERREAVADVRDAAPGQRAPERRSEVSSRSPAGRDQLEEVAVIARELAKPNTVDETLQRVVDLGGRYISGCEAASISFVKHGTISTPVHTGPLALDLDQAQYRLGQGPCLQAIAEHETIIIDDLERDDRWRVWREVALDAEVRSTISFRLFYVADGEDTVGALNMYATRAHAFQGWAQVMGQVFASHAAVALKAAITEAGLEEAITTRDRIGQAKGILMERHRVSAQQAFEILRQASNDRNTTIRELARDITETGTLR